MSDENKTPNVGKLINFTTITGVTYVIDANGNSLSLVFSVRPKKCLNVNVYPDKFSILYALSVMRNCSIKFSRWNFF